MKGDFFLTTWFLEAMRWVYGNIGNVVITILICTVVLKLITLVSDIKNRQSSAKMALIQPEIAKVQERYKNNPQKAQQEQQKIMKNNGVSMFGSCLPMLITMPLFFCFIAAFRFWGYEMTLRLLAEESGAAMELFTSFKFLWINNIWQPDNGMMPVIQTAENFLATKDLGRLLFLQDNPEVLQRLVDMGIATFSRTYDAGTHVFVESIEFLQTPSAIAAYNAQMQQFIDYYPGQNNGWFLMSVISAGTNFLSMWLTQRGQPKPDKSQPGANSSKMMMYMFPVMSFIVCLTSNAAFAIYWTISAVITIITNLILNRKYPRAALESAPAKKEKEVKK